MSSKSEQMSWIL